MIFAFDLDGTLDVPAIGKLARHLIMCGHDVHIITACFPESGGWQDEDAKRAKLKRLGIPATMTQTANNAQLHILQATNVNSPIMDRLRELGLQKGALCEQLGVGVIFDDSPTFCEMIPRMNGHVTVLRVM